ncbi:hypothetical protein JVT61DRAFT_3067 [Boletus reticuloceps]|uniref:Beta-galactosidase n=1 Tax=Boletus reticuloceps TaxID=495285 RepID=A0A8I2YR40_9AGAM|nr:hypothetical protein JVT61DRAFT_3067 [Boletus reticuloceps]
MPVQSLYLDLFQKVKCVGFNTVSFYVFWGIVEPRRGEISFEGFRDLQPWFDAAKQAGVYLMARPGALLFNIRQREIQSWKSDPANAYDFWVMFSPSTGSFANYSTTNPILIQGGYLIRSVQISGTTLEITGDLNSTTSFEIIAPSASFEAATTSYGTITSSKCASLPSIQLPDLESLTWVGGHKSLPWTSASESQRKLLIPSQKSNQLNGRPHYHRQPPRGILSYSFVGGSGTKISVWKVAGNLEGENILLSLAWLG